MIIRLLLALFLFTVPAYGQAVNGLSGPTVNGLTGATVNGISLVSCTANTITVDTQPTSLSITQNGSAESAGTASDTAGGTIAASAYNLSGAGCFTVSGNSGSATVTPCSGACPTLPCTGYVAWNDASPGGGYCVPTQAQSSQITVSASSSETEETITGPIIFSSTWTGSDAVNTGAGAGHVWTATSGTVFSKGATPGGGWNGQNGYAVFTEASGGARHTLDTSISLTSSFSFRQILRIDSGIPATSEYISLLTGRGGGENIIIVQIYKDAGNSNHRTLRFIVNNTSASGQSLGSIDIDSTVGSYIQVLGKFQKNTSNGAQFQVWSANGATQIGSTLDASFTVENLIPSSFSVGTYAGDYSTITISLDETELRNDYPTDLSSIRKTY